MRIKSSLIIEYVEDDPTQTFLYLTEIHAVRSNLDGHMFILATSPQSSTVVILHIEIDDTKLDMKEWFDLRPLTAST